MSAECRGRCLKQCNCFCVIDIHFDRQMHEIHRFDLKIVEVDCECAEDISRKYKQDENCTCGHQAHNGYCPGVCCSLIPCPIYRNPEPEWFMDCQEGTCDMCAISNLENNKAGRVTGRIMRLLVTFFYLVRGHFRVSDSSVCPFG